ncbi:MAG TPA: T9SS type A sorting domain-containing protein, partial [Bacteroidia bacterium]|nr:T9SS type A sorting domain-containing protein [Bacteroidia bacterium]
DPLSVFAPTGEALLRVYPVPAREILRFSWKSNENHDAELVLLDTYGRVCGQTELNNLGGSLDVSQLAAGMYLYRVSKQGNVLETGKIVVAR